MDMRSQGGFPRRPMNLHQHREDGCVTCIVGQILYVFGVKDRPNLRAIDREAGARNEDPLFDADAYYYLLRRGFTIEELLIEDPQGLLSGGKDYLKALYGEEWGKEHEDHFTLEEVARIQRLTREDYVRTRPYRTSGKYRQRVKMPTPADVQAMLARGLAVDATYESGERDRIQHGALLVPDATEPDRVWLYIPSAQGITYGRHGLREALRSIRYDRSIAGIWR